MKKISTIIILLFSSAGIFAQSPQKITYQAVVRNATGTLVALKPVGMRLSIIQGSEFGPSVYVETQTPTTNSNGLLSINIGGGTVLVGTISAINWSNGPYYLKSELDPNGATSYSISGTQQLLSVPYALYTDKAKVAIHSDSANTAKVADKALVSDSLKATAKIALDQLRAGGALTNQYLRWDGLNWVPATITPLNAGNGIGITNNTIGTQWSSGPSGPYTDSLNVGIGTKSPISKFNVSGSGFNVITTNFEGPGWNSFYRYGRYLGYLGVFSDTASLDFGTNGNGTNVNLVTSATPRLTVTTAGNVGIGTTIPAAKLDVNGKTKTTDLQVTNSAGVGKVLTSDASGNATWTNLSGRISNFVSNSGYGNNPTTTNAFIGQTVTFTITSTQKVHVTVTKAMGSSATGGANSLNLYMGYQISAGTITNVGAGILGLSCLQNSRELYTMEWTFSGLAAGTYTFGMTGSSTNAANWNSNEFSYLTALVIE